MPFPLTIDRTDPYGVDLAFDRTGDLVVWPTGQLGVVQGPENCVQALMLWMLTEVGELPLAPHAGSGFQAMVGDKLDEQLVTVRAEAELRRILAGDRRFLAARETEAREVDTDRLLVSTILTLAAGEDLVVSDLSTPTVAEITDSPLASDLGQIEQSDLLDTIDFFPQPEEADTLADLNQLGQLARDISEAEISLFDLPGTGD